MVIKLPILRLSRVLFILVGVLVLSVVTLHTLGSGLSWRYPEKSISLEHSLIIELICLNQGLTLFILPLCQMLVLSFPIGLLSH